MTLSDSDVSLFVKEYINLFNRIQWLDFAIRNDPQNSTLEELFESVTKTRALMEVLAEEEGINLKKHQ